jgi:hypothetical protein
LCVNFDFKKGFGAIFTQTHLVTLVSRLLAEGRGGGRQSQHFSRLSAAEIARKLITLPFRGKKCGPQGCQMAYFQTKNSKFGKNFGGYCNGGYWYSLCPFGIF